MHRPPADAVAELGTPQRRHASAGDEISRRPDQRSSQVPGGLHAQLGTVPAGSQGGAPEDQLGTPSEVFVDGDRPQHRGGHRSPRAGRDRGPGPTVTKCHDVGDHRGACGTEGTGRQPDRPHQITQLGQPVTLLRELASRV
jgi:hypothetical protein